MAIISADLWREMMENHNRFGLNAAQISNLLQQRGVYVSRQAVWARMEREKRKKT